MSYVDVPTTIDELDETGGLAARAADVQEIMSEGPSRGDFLKRFAVGAGATAVAASMVGPAAALGAEQKATPAGDLVILNYALTLEYLEDAFYAEANTRRRHLNSANRYFARIVGSHESDHVTALIATIKKLGGRPVHRGRYNFGNTTASNSKFMKTALALEETGVPAYIGQAPFVFNKDVLLAAARIATVEARHAAWMRSMLGVNPAPRAFDAQRTSAGTLKVVRSTGFVAGL